MNQLREQELVGHLFAIQKVKGVWGLKTFQTGIKLVYYKISGQYSLRLDHCGLLGLRHMYSKEGVYGSFQSQQVVAGIGRKSCSYKTWLQISLK